MRYIRTLSVPVAHPFFSVPGVISGCRLRMPDLNDAECERIQIVISKLSHDHLQHGANFPAAVAAAMEVASIFNDMSGMQKRALVSAVIHHIASQHVPAFQPYLPLAEPLCDTIMQAAQHRLRLRAAAGRCFPCLYRSTMNRDADP